MKNYVVTYPAEYLFKKAEDIPIKDINKDTFGTIASAMLEQLERKKGVGLAANQVGLPFNMTVIKLRTQTYILLNPRIIKYSEQKMKSPEGCLSLPGVQALVPRYKEITVEYENLDGETVQLEATDLLSAALQHEIDHLNGKTLLYYLSTPKQEKAKRLIKYSRRRR